MIRSKIDYADQDIELLTGVAAGKADSEGIFPEDSVNGRVQLRLRTLAGLRMQYTSAVKGLTAGASLENRQAGKTVRPVLALRKRYLRDNYTDFQDILS